MAMRTPKTTQNQMTLFLLFVLGAGCRLPAQSLPDGLFKQSFSAAQLQEDARLLRQGLEKLHPALYRYTPREEMDSSFAGLINKANREMTYQAFYREVEAVVTRVRCQHTVAAPQASMLKRIEREGRFFPLKVHWDFEPLSAYAVFDFSSRSAPHPGTRIISINGKPVEEIAETLLSHFPSDGYIRTNQHSRLQFGVEFQFWYYMLIGQPDTFHVVLQTPNGERLTRQYDAVTFKEWKRNFRKKYGSPKDPYMRTFTRHYVAMEKKNRAQPLRVEFLSDQTALLTVGNFDSGKFTAIIADAFEQIRQKQTEHLIIDVRNNGGGSDKLGRFLFRHLIRQPAAYFDSLYATAHIPFLLQHTERDTAWWQETRPMLDSLPDGRWATKPRVNKGLLIQQPEENHFAGKVYILINGRSASTTAEFTAAAHFHKLATFIGEESGGAYHGGNGGDFAALVLPNTRIEVNIPLAKYVMNSRNTDLKGRGTLPDYPVPTTIRDILALKDPQLEFALQLIQRMK